MNCDIVFPKNNEEEFIRMAQDLGFDSLILTYTSPSAFTKKKYAIPTSNALLVDKKKVGRMRNKAALLLVKSDGADRATIEQHRPDLLFAIEEEQRKDYVHQRGSGLNALLCKRAHQNEVIIGFSFRSLLENTGKRQRILGRMSQNIRLCRKFDVKMSIASFAQDPYQMRAYHDLIALFTSLGMHPSEAKTALTTALARLDTQAASKKDTAQGTHPKS